MASSDGLFASAPTVVMQPNHHNQYFASSHYIDQNGSAVVSNGVSPSSSANVGSFASNTPLAETPGSLAGRKRSRGDIHAPEDDNDLARDHDLDLSAPVGSTCNAAENRPFELQHIKRPSLSSRKSQRVEPSVLSDDHLAQLVLPAQMREATSEPLISEVTRLLGISWTRMDSTEARQINQAAYAKWIQNHYASLKDVSVWFQYANEDCPAYLVQATNAYTGQMEFYLFSDDLTEARLITRESEQLVPRLQMMPRLHLAAPGGHIRAQSNSTTAAQSRNAEAKANISTTIVVPDNEMNGDVPSRVLAEPTGICSAHASDMDWM